MFAQVQQADSVELILQTPSGQLIRPTDSGNFVVDRACHFQVLTDEELSRVFALITDPRNRAILALMVFGGLQMRDVVALDVSSLVERGKGGLVLIPQLARDTARLVPLGPWAFQIVLTYLESTNRLLGDEGPLFLTRESTEGADEGVRGLSRQEVSLVVMRTLLLAGIDRGPVEEPGLDGQVALPEIMRHTFVARFLRAGGRTFNLQALLGHRSLDQTRRYVRRFLGYGPKKS